MVITAKQLNSGHALSREDQPYVKDLADALAASPRITLVIGAGFSMDAGLPSWGQLIEVLARGIKPINGVDLGDLALADRDDVMRKAEYVISMKLKSDGFGVTENLVRDALYTKHPFAGPGPLLRAVASLVSCICPRASILTTNFDEMIEIALQGHKPPIEAKPFTLDKKQAWDRLQKRPSTGSAVPIFHLHGRVSRNSNEKNPMVVLTESHFLRHGPKVRQVVVDALNSSTVIFLGLSMTDPNLIGPLWDTQESRNPVFVVSVPGKVGKADLNTSRLYAIEKNRYLEEVLKVSPIFLKSYSQLEQLIYELEVAVRLPVRFQLPKSDKECVAHGVRLERLLDKAYTRLGCRSTQQRPIGEPSEKLRELLDSYIGTAKSPGSLREVIDDMSSEAETADRLNELSHQVSAAPSTKESYCLQLWLRVRGNRSRKPMFALQLVGTGDRSFYSAEALSDPEPIDESSENMAARAAAKGKAQIWRVQPEYSMGGLWKGIFATPIRLIEDISHGAENIRIPCAVGAIALLTTHQIKVRNEPLSVPKPQLSFLSVTDSNQRQQLAGLLEAIGQDILK